MNILRKSIITLATFAAVNLNAEVFQIAQDNHGSTARGTIAKASGRAVAMPVNSKSTAFLNFKFNQAGYSVEQIASARLVIYFPQVTKEGALSVHPLISGFQETFATPTIPNPELGGVISTIPVTKSLQKNFVVIDVTNVVKSWASGYPEFGFGISGDAVVACTIGSKEGAATGYPAILEVDTTSTVITGAQAVVSGSIALDEYEAGNGTLAGGSLRFGGLDSGEGILSKRTATGNQFGLDFLTGSISRMSISLNGNVGIGTTTPSVKLDVAGLGQMQGLDLRGAANSYIDFSANTGADFKARLIYPGLSDNRLIFQGIPVTFDNNIGIGTATPTQARLVVLGSSGSNSFGRFTSVFDTGTFVDSDGDANLSASIYADGQVHAPVFIAFSDARIKDIIGHSDATADLDTLRKIEITDYTHKDTATKGAGPVKKVIAQQVETVFPQAVSKSTDVIPDIMKSAPEQDGWITLATDLKVGDRVRIVGEKAEGIHAVTEVKEGAFRTAFQPEGDKVFVYGREVNDFRAVDYDAIAMLNVSATQELAKQLEAKATEIATLKAENETLRKKLADNEARDSAIEARLARIESAGASIPTLKTSQGAPSPASANPSTGTHPVRD